MDRHFLNNEKVHYEEGFNLKQAGLKATLPRLKILELLENSQQRHLSAEEVFRKLLSDNEDVGLATVYRVLTQFESAGILTRHNFEGDHAVFELNRGEHHDHIICIRCGKVEEFLDETIEQHQKDIAAERGYSIVDHSMYIYAVCTGCDKK
jgi:Fur family transcriptional regulator, ferric uptake regulator